MIANTWKELITVRSNNSWVTFMVEMKIVFMKSYQVVIFIVYKLLNREICVINFGIEHTRSVL